jgi:hypothetical protein
VIGYGWYPTTALVEAITSLNEDAPEPERLASVLSVDSFDHHDPHHGSAVPIGDNVMQLFNQTSRSFWTSVVE